jgi:hypothetical protein
LFELVGALRHVKVKKRFEARLDVEASTAFFGGA